MAALDLRRGDTAAAIDELDRLVALTDIPASLRQRAAQILSVISQASNRPCGQLSLKDKTTRVDR